MKPKQDPLSDLAMWSTWQEKVKAALPNFAADKIYVEQMSPSEDEFIEVLLDLFDRRVVTDSTGMMRDAEYGARIVDTPMGPVTRMWLDAQVEIDFLCRNFRKMGPLLRDFSVFEIGGGYGRLAVELSPIVDLVVNVDPVPISVKLYQSYTDKHGQINILGMDIARYRKTKEQLINQFQLAINIHSWNECSLTSIALWLQEIRDLRIPYLFTVSHGSKVQPERGKEYYSWGKGQPSFKPLLEAEFELVAEEHIGLGKHPHALWRRK